MAITISKKELDNFNGPTMTVNCPGCNAKAIAATIIGDYTNHYELYHAEKTCQYEWQYSTYEQCKELQISKFTHEKQTTIPKQRKHDKSFGTIGALPMAIIICSSAIGGPLGIPIGIGVAKLFGKAVGSGSYPTVIAEQESYAMEPYFKHLPNHYINERFRKEAAPFLDDRKRRKKRESGWKSPYYERSS